MGVQAGSMRASAMGVRSRQGARSPVEPPIDMLRWGLFFFIIVVISTVHAYVPPLAKLRPGLILWLFIAAYPLMMPRTLRLENLQSSWVVKALAVLFACALLSIPFGISMGQAGKHFIDIYSRVMLFAIILLVAIRGVRDLRFFVWAYVASIALLIIMALTVMELGAVAGGIQRLQGEHMYDSNDMGVLINVALPLGLLCAHTSRGWRRWAAWGVVLGVPLTVAMLGSRGAFVGLVAVGVTLLITARNINVWKRVLLVPTAAIAIMVGAPEGYWTQMRTIIEPEDDYNLTSVDGRKGLATRGLEYISERPVFGLGMSNFGRAEGTISRKAREAPVGTGIKWTAPHNTYLQVGAELGVPALIAWLTLSLGGIFAVSRMSRRVPDGWRNGTPEQRFLHGTGFYLPAAFVGFAVPATFVSHAYLPQFYILVAFLAAYLTFTRRELARERAARRFRMSAPLVARTV
jgi:O-antigen ligase